MGSVCFSYFYFFVFICFHLFVCLFVCLFFLGGGGNRLPVLCWLVGAPPICHQCHLAKNEMWVSEMCFASLVLWTVCKNAHEHTDAYAGCGRPTLNCIERFELGSFRSDTAVTEGFKGFLSAFKSSSRSTGSTDRFSLLCLSPDLRWILCPTA